MYAQPTVNKLSLPRILCLHGGGSNNAIFTAQLRSFVRHLTDFRFVFAEARLPSEAGPGIIPVFKDYAPYYRWTGWRTEHPVAETEIARQQIIQLVEQAKEADDGTGQWVAILGFSQGAGVAASLLFYQQNCSPGQEYKFGVLIAGTYPLMTLGPGQSSANREDLVESSESESLADTRLMLPTIHVHGLRDPDIRYQRRLLEQCCDQTSAKLYAWDGDHSVPFSDDDVLPIVQEIRRMARSQGVRLR